jgi:hypothetical protein
MRGFEESIAAARAAVDDMEAMISGAEPDGPKALLEAAEEAHQAIHHAVHAAIVPVLERYEHDHLEQEGGTDRGREVEEDFESQIMKAGKRAMDQLSKKQ